MLSSGVWAGEIPIHKAHDLEEVGASKRTMKQELERIGYLGATDSSHISMPIAVRYPIRSPDLKAESIKAHFELHIEQGPLLETHKKKIGIVHGVQAYRWHTLTVKGRDCRKSYAGPLLMFNAQRRNCALFNTKGSLTVFKTLALPVLRTVQMLYLQQQN